MNARRITIVSLLMLALGSSTASAQESIVSPSHHPWGRFSPGAWKLVHVEAETLDGNGKVVSTSVTETKSSLVRIDTDGVVLQVEVGMQVAGRQFDGQPQSIKQGFQGELVGPQVQFKAPQPSHVLLEGQKCECKLQEVDYTGTNSHTVANISFSDTVWPHVLKRQSTTTDSSGAVLSETNSEVLAHDMPEKVLTEIKNSAYVQTIQKGPKGVVTTLSMTTIDVPGGVFAQSTKETDSSGRLVRRSTLSLVGYGLKNDDERNGLFGRMRMRRKASK